MKFSEHFTSLLLITFFFRLSQANVIEGNLKVTSCNCTECCYQNNSDIYVHVVYQFADGSFGINITGDPIEVGKPAQNCSYYIQNFESCVQTSENVTDNYVYRYLDCSQLDSSIGNATIVGNINDQTYIQFLLTQNSNQCEIIFNFSERESFGIWTIFIFGALGMIFS